MKIRLLTLIFILIGLYTGYSQTGSELFVMYNASCMDRLEYGYAFTPEDNQYVKYHIKITPTEVLVLEVGTENSSPRQTYLSAPPVTCGDTDAFSRELVDKIRNNRAQVYMVRPVQGNQYQVTKVINASYFRRDSRGVLYDSREFSFDHIGGLNIGENLTKGSPSGINVTYEGVTKYKCADAYMFKQTFSFDPNLYRELFFVSGLGIVEERSNQGADNTFLLRDVNDTPFDTYLQRMCASGITVSANFLTGGSAFPAQVSNVQPGTIPTGTTAAPSDHVVEKGETLYSIARQYGVQVADLQRWNNMGSSTTLRVGERLQVSTPQSASVSTTGAAPAYTGAATAGTTTYTPSTGGATTYQPAPATETLTPKGDPRYAWNTTDGWHTVQPGETPALLALKYGFTEARFRDMNGLGPTDVLVSGQRLRTTYCPPCPPSGATTTSTPAATQGAGATGSNWPYNQPVTQPAPYNYAGGAPLGTPTDQWGIRGTPATTTPATGAGTVASPASTQFEPYRTTGLDFSSPAESARAYPSSTQSPTRNLETTTPGATGTVPTPGGFGTPIAPGTSSGAYPQSYSQPLNSGLPDRNYSFSYGAGGAKTTTTGNTTGTPSSYNQPTTTTGKRTIHTVREGETIESIARKYNVSADYLRQLNNLDRNEILIPYQPLYIN